MVVCAGFCEDDPTAPVSVTTQQSPCAAARSSAATARCISRCGKTPPTPPELRSRSSIRRSAGWGCSSATTRHSRRLHAHLLSRALRSSPACLRGRPAVPTPRRSSPTTAGPSVSISSTRPGRWRTRWSGWRRIRPGTFGSLRFVCSAKVCGPGGDVLATTGTKPGVAAADVDIAGALAGARRSMFHLRDRRPELYPDSDGRLPALVTS